MGRRVIATSIFLTFVVALAQSGFAIDRNTVISLAKSYADHQWTCASANTTASCSSSYTSDYSPGTYIGVAYDWGGYKTIAQYDDELSRGFGAGSHSWHGVLSCTTGVDCSGYVSKCWQEGHYTTSTLDKISSVIPKESVLKGDVFNKAGSHVVLFSHFDNSGAPVYYEASGSASKVGLNATGGWSYLNGYTPRRYNKIEEDAPTPAEGTVKGAVFEDTGAGTADMTIRLTGATVVVKETGASQTAQGADALWSFTLETGSYTFIASHTGYKTDQRICNVVADQTTWCSIGLFKEIQDAGELDTGGPDIPEEDTGWDWDIVPDAGGDDNEPDVSNEDASWDWDIASDVGEEDVLTPDGGDDSDEDVGQEDNSIEEDDSGGEFETGDAEGESDDDDNDDDDKSEEAPLVDDGGEESGAGVDFGGEGGNTKSSPGRSELAELSLSDEPQTGCNCKVTGR